MIRLQGRLVLMSAAVISMLLLQACGQNTGTEGSGESFAAVTEDSNSPEGVTTARVSAAPQASAAVSPAVESTPAAEAVPATSGPDNAKAAAPSEEPIKAGEDEDGGATTQDTATEDKAAVISKPSANPSPKPTAKPAAAAAGAKQASAKQTAGFIPGAASPSPVGSAQPSAAPSAEAKVAREDGTVKKSVEASSVPAVSSAPVTSPPQSAGTATQSVPSNTGYTAIDWSGFFDGSDQTRPSEHFWDLSGSKVTIKGFMGEVLSFEKNWFLLIPEPGAECPFDNGDETYWNKIMIVFVPEGSKLRYTSGPLEISGRLDVGIKIDESGYKTMFRLYDASFKSI